MVGAEDLSSPGLTSGWCSEMTSCGLHDLHFYFAARNGMGKAPGLSECVSVRERSVLVTGDPESPVISGRHARYGAAHGA
jgi:hypothetical protein